MRARYHSRVGAAAYRGDKGQPEATPTPLWSDNPSECDLLGFSHIGAPALEALDREKLDPVAVGVVGWWGSGKSTILKLIERDLRETPWELSDLDAVVLVVTRSLAERQLAAARADELTLWGVGFHPALPDALRAFDVRAFADALETASFVAEVGVDRRSKASLDEQVAVFAEILQAVQRVPRPVSIHSTGATKGVLDLLRLPRSRRRSSTGSAAHRARRRGR